MAWIAGLTGTALAGKGVWDVDLGGLQYKTANTANASPQAATGLDPSYPADWSLVSPQSHPTVDFSAYPAQNACKAMGGRLPNAQELIAIFASKASYGNNFGGTYYWSATQYNDTLGRFVTVTGGTSGDDKAANHYVRCVTDTPPVTTNYPLITRTSRGLLNLIGA